MRTRTRRIRAEKTMLATPFSPTSYRRGTRPCTAQLSAHVPGHHSDGKSPTHYLARREATHQQGEPVSHVSHHELVARGSTALLDAVCQAINQTGERLANTTEAECQANAFANSPSMDCSAEDTFSPNPRNPPVAWAERNCHASRKWLSMFPPSARRRKGIVTRSRRCNR